MRLDEIIQSSGLLGQGKPDRFVPLFAKFEGRPYEDGKLTIVGKLGLAPTEPKTPREFDALMKTLGYTWGQWDKSVKPFWYRPGEALYTFVESTDNYVYWIERIHSLFSDRDGRFLLEQNKDIDTTSPVSMMKIIDRKSKGVGTGYDYYSVGRPAPGHYKLGCVDDDKRIFEYLIDLRGAGLR